MTNMQNNSARWKQDLVLLGGGHANALVLQKMAMAAPAGLRLTLVSEFSDSPYSGMLPGLVAGHYKHADAHIDLRRLCHYAGARFIQASVTGVDVARQRVQLQGRPDLEFDMLSVNTGATPDLTVPGAREYVIPVKPISQFWPRWQRVLSRLETSTSRQTLVIVGGGAGSVELALAMACRLRSCTAKHDLVLVTRADSLLPGYPRRMLYWLQRRLQAHDIRVHCRFDVAEVTAQGLRSAAGDILPAQTVFWCTQAQAAAWPERSGLETTAGGFIRVLPSLQTLAHPGIFAAGDCAWVDAAPSPRAGVYAVRQAPVLFDNLCRLFAGQPLRTFHPQKHFLSLLMTGGQDAVGARGSVAIAGHWVWRWKDRIDRRFMAMLQNLPVQPPPRQTVDSSLEPPAMRCGGCGGKIGADALKQALAALKPVAAAANCPLAGSDDAAVIELSPAANVPLLVQSVDAIKPLFDDPYLFARVATLHALSDLYAMNAQPHSVQLQVQLPVMDERLQVRDMQQLLQGVQHELEAVAAQLLGGHTLEAETLQLGMTVNGFAGRQTLLRKAGAVAGDVLILTKPLGTGAIFSAAMRGAALGHWIDQAIAVLLLSNGPAAAILARFQPHALTDVTGFGLLGHLLEMLEGSSGQAAALSLSRIPLMDGALDCIRAGYYSTLAPANQRARHRVNLQGIEADNAHYQLLFDPQTSGGLLAAVAAGEADACLQALQTAGVSAAQIGRIEPLENSEQSGQSVAGGQVIIRP